MASLLHPWKNLIFGHGLNMVSGRDVEPEGKKHP